ncbi:shoc2 [Echinococcus granulosus]|uniref:Shoc2 n=1 Tax=Echinococcus granulosus TaxID=6210 RepID=W6UPM7_ECHGR|nr:shoc2 [Echinococcus granulosus]EUB55354.1 shoc2 [Echinococcus granulosus]
MASGTVNGSNNSPESVSYAHNIGHDLDYLDMVNTLETTSLNSQKKSSLVGSTPFDPKKSKVTVQRPGEQKAYQCGPNSRKNKKSDSSVTCGMANLTNPSLHMSPLPSRRAWLLFKPEQRPHGHWAAVTPVSVCVRGCVRVRKFKCGRAATSCVYPLTLSPLCLRRLRTPGTYTRTRTRECALSRALTAVLAILGFRVLPWLPASPHVSAPVGPWIRCPLQAHPVLSESPNVLTCVARYCLC